jgi:hypothetical protein
MITAGITAAVAGVLALFGVKPGPYLVGVAIGVKVAIVAIGLIFGARFFRRRAAAKAASDTSTAK